MEYDAQVFKMKANKKARNVWMALSLILSLSYTSDTAKGLHTLPYYAMFMAVCWIPFLFGVVVLRLQGAATQYYKFIVAVGYGVFYAFVVCTSESILSFMYISSDEYAGFVQRQDVYGAMWHWYISDQYCQQCT